MTEPLDTKLQHAVAVWRDFWGENLKSVALFGSAARGEWAEKSSDINLLLVLSHSDLYSRWPEASAIAKRLFRKSYALPLLMTPGYLRSSLDVFPMEFLDMKLFHKTLFGEELLADLAIDEKNVRLQAEREIKGKWVQLRQAALERGGETLEMRNLLAMSVPTWNNVFQAILFIHGKEIPAQKREVIAGGAELAGVDPTVFLELVAIRKEKRGLNRTQAWDLTLKTLAQVDSLARFVDKDFL